MNGNFASLVGSNSRVLLLFVILKKEEGQRIILIHRP